MASIANDPNGRRRILFVSPDGSRKVLRLGKSSKRQAETVKARVELLLAAKITGTAPDDETSRWIASLAETLRDKLAGVGLIDKPERAALGAFLDEYLAKRQTLVTAGKLNPDTLRIERVTRDCLIDHLGADARMREITEADAEDFRNWLLASGGRPSKRCGPEIVVKERTPLAEATARKRCSVAGKFFRYALRKGLVRINPFDAVPKANVATKRRAYIGAADARKVLDQLPSTEWRLLFALSRWGGLRVGSEVRLLTWVDVDWDKARLLVRSPKTAHHAGRETRLVPIFPELAAILAERFEEAETGEQFVLPMLQGRTDASLRKTLERAIQRAGLTVWPRLWHNLRATRQTELENEFPSHVVCAWLGNSEAVARAHYLQVTDEHFEKAAQKAAHSTHPAEDPSHDPFDGAAQNRRENDTEQVVNELLRRSEKVAQNPAQSASVRGVYACQYSGENEKPSRKSVVVKRSQPQTKVKAVGEGPLHPGNSSGKTSISLQGGAESGALGAASDPELASIAAAWPMLSGHAKATILGIVRKAAVVTGLKR